MYHLFFFFKQKTAYEMRISDWSSDVCSSDLAALRRGHRADRIRHRPAGKRRTVGWVGFINPATKETDNRTPERWVDGANPAYVDFLSADRVAKLAVRYRPVLEDGEAIVRIAMLCEDTAAACRSAEHTSEVQSLLRTS